MRDAIGVGVALEGGDQAEIVERGRAQLDGQLAHRFERFGGQLAQLVDLAAHLRRGARPLEDLQADQQRRQRLRRLVVQLAGDALALVFLGRQHLLGHLLQQAAVLLQHVEHGVQRLAQALDVGIAEQHALGAGVEVARGDPIDGALQRVQRLQRQRQHDGVDQHAAGEADDEHHRDGRPVDLAAARTGDERQREPGAEADADQDDDQLATSTFRNSGRPSRAEPTLLRVSRGTGGVGDGGGGGGQLGRKCRSAPGRRNAD